MPSSSSVAGTAPFLSVVYRTNLTRCGRRFGGEMLGPARFDHIEMCAREVCRAFKLKDDMATSIATLKSLDDILADLRKELAALQAKKSTDGDASTSEGKASPSIPAPKKASNPYAALEESLDVTKAKRLITAREHSIKSVKLALKKARASEAA